jgi:uncharacterized protein
MKALITGASEGIGRSLAILLKDKGYSITVVARNQTRLQDLIRELGGGSHQAFSADLSTADGVNRVVDKIKSEKYDLLVNNAGMATYGSFRDVENSDLHHMCLVNSDTVMDLSHAFLKTARSGDALINVSSTASFLPMPVTSVYAGNKAFVTAFSQSLWYEERKRGVYVLALCPGMTRTQFHSRAGGKSDQIPDWFSQTPEQVAQMAWKHLQKRSQPVVISGPQKYLIFLSRFVPRKWLTLMAGKTLEWGMKK